MAEYRAKAKGSISQAKNEPAASSASPKPAYGRAAAKTAEPIASAPSANQSSSSSSFTLFGIGGPARQPAPNKLKVKDDDLMVFFRQLSVILQTGVPLSQGLELLSENMTNQQFAYAVSQISGRLNAGQDLSNSFAAYPKVFKPIMVGLIKAGEFGGILDNVVDRIASLIEQQAKLRGQIIGAMIYPGIVLFIAITVGLGMLIGIVPQFANMFDDLGAELPGITKFMLALSKAVTDLVVIGGVLGGLFASGFLFSRYYATKAGRLNADTQVLKIPLFGPLLLKYEVASFCDTMATLANAGVPAVEALDITQQALSNTLIRKTVMYTIARAQQGEPISQAILSQNTMPRLVPAMIKIGEETGEFSFMLEKLATFYAREIESSVTKLAKAMEPAVVLVVAGIVGTIVVALYLPMFDLISAFKGG